jgi:hypothetical protein
VHEASEIAQLMSGGADVLTAMQRLVAKRTP